MLVIRISGKYKIQSSKPCAQCLQTMVEMPEKKGYKVHRVYYSNENEDIERTTLSSLLQQEMHYSKGYRYSKAKSV